MKLPHRLMFKNLEILFERDVINHEYKDWRNKLTLVEYDDFKESFYNTMLNNGSDEIHAEYCLINEIKHLAKLYNRLILIKESENLFNRNRK